jgi:hypothetical protein
MPPVGIAPAMMVRLSSDDFLTKVLSWPEETRIGLPRDGGRGRAEGRRSEEDEKVRALEHALAPDRSDPRKASVLLCRSQTTRPFSFSFHLHFFFFSLLFLFPFPLSTRYGVALELWLQPGQLMMHAVVLASIHWPKLIKTVMVCVIWTRSGLLSILATHWCNSNSMLFPRAMQLLVAFFFSFMLLNWTGG